MVYGCGNKCVKYLVFLFNFLVFVIGIAVLALSLSIRYSNEVQKYFQNIFDKESAGVDLNQMYIPLYVLAAIGALLLLTGFLGCCGAWCENTCLLAIFFSIILILFVAELACGIALLVNQDKFKTAMFDGIKKQMPKYITGGLNQEQKDAIDQMQTKLQCCGCYNSTDYGTPTTASLPASCFSDGATHLKMYPLGCCQKVWNDATSQIGVVAGVSIGILVIELLAMVFSCILCQAFRRGDYQYA